MKIAPRAVAAFLASPGAQARAALLYGPDEGLARERARQIAAKLAGAGSVDSAAVEMDGDSLKTDPTRLADALSALSLLGDTQFVVLRDAGDRSAALIADAIPEGTRPGERHFLIVTAGELSPRSPLRALFESRADFAAIACYKDEAVDLQGLIRETLAGAGVQAGREVTEYLLRSLGNDRQVTRSELAKLLLYLGDEKQLTLAQAQAVIGENRDVALDEIALAVGGRQTEALERHLARAFREGVAPVALLRAVQRHFQRLYTVCAAMEAGASPDQAVAGLKPTVFFRHVPAMTSQARSISREKLARALTLLAEAEAECKGGTLAPTLACHRALLRLAA